MDWVGHCYVHAPLPSQTPDAQVVPLVHGSPLAPRQNLGVVVLHLLLTQSVSVAHVLPTILRQSPIPLQTDPV
ncbi:MAG TPA: hypothetical protein PK156_47735, partial [Polyangium sp.]|nr:hypothetical protein [Polyangium sp.]